MGLNIHTDNYPSMTNSHQQSVFHVKLETNDPVTTEIIKTRIQALIFNLGEADVSVHTSITSSSSMDNEPF